MQLNAKEAGKSAQFQQDLAQAVRGIDGTDHFPVERLAVYQRLVHNNIHGFIDRCFTQTPQYCDNWHALKQDFIKKGSSSSPYFQDIAGEFLGFCQDTAAVPEHILELMHFEHSQLIAEVAVIPNKASVDWDEDSLFVLSDAAVLGEYTYNVCADHLDFSTKDTYTLTWQDSEGMVYYRALDNIEFFLLSLVAESALSLTMLLQQLSEVIGDADKTWRDNISAQWSEWICNDVLVMSNA